MRHLTALVILVAATSLVMALWVNEGPLWQWVMTQREEFDATEEVRLLRGRWIHGKYLSEGNEQECSSLFPQNRPIGGWRYILRWSAEPQPHGPFAYYHDNGFKAMQGVYRHGFQESVTVWDREGKIWWQIRAEPFDSQSGYSLFEQRQLGGQSVREVQRVSRLPGLMDPDSNKRDAPWWWGVADQAEPSAPWWNENDK